MTVLKAIILGVVQGITEFCRSQAAGIFRLRSIFYIPVGKAPFSFPLCSIWALCSPFF